MTRRLPQVSGLELVRALEKVGFVRVRQTGSHVIMRREQPFTQVTVPAHRELGRGILRAILRQAELSPEAFISLL